MLVVAGKLKPFQDGDQGARRLRMLCLTPYFTDGILAELGGLLNPFGVFYVTASALPSALGTNDGLLRLPGMIRRLSSSEVRQIGPIRRGVLAES